MEHTERQHSPRKETRVCKRHYDHLHLSKEPQNSQFSPSNQQASSPLSLHINSLAVKDYRGRSELSASDPLLANLVINLSVFVITSVDS
jgi:hypothetical protein